MANETSQRDVNGEFAASKAQQIESANNPNEFLENMIANDKVRYLGADRYRVMEGWDVGEVFTYRPLTDDQKDANTARIVGEHGLDIKADGTAAFYSKDHPAWWDLDGTHVIKGGYSSVTNILDMTGLNWDTVLTPQQGMNPVTGKLDTYMEDYVSNPKTGEISQRPVGYHTRRGDTGEILGAVGRIYTPISNAKAFGFLDELFGDRLMVCETAGSFRNGSKTFFTAELPEDMIVDPSGFADHIRQYLAVVNTHDGSGLFQAVATPWRMVCKNTERLGIKNAVTKWSVRHTKNAMTNVELAKRTLGLTTAYYAEWIKDETALVAVPFSANQIDALCDQVWGERNADAGKAATTIENKRRDQVHALFNMEADRCGANGYAAERAITGYLDHYAALRPRGVLRGNRLAASAVSIMEGTADETKTRTHAKLMMLVNN
jgi:phage/plasmid-like protein (TIGR03299 family)